MADEKHKLGSENEPEANLEWVGLQYYRKDKTTNTIQERSFPFWGPSLEWAVMHAKQSNKLPKEKRTYWTHVAVHANLTETKNGATIRHNHADTYEEIL